MRRVSTADDIVTGALVTWGPHEQLGVVHKIEVDGDGRAGDERFERDDESVVGDESRMDAVRELAQLTQ